MGAALSYARRYALFALVGIAGEDDLDAPDLGASPRAGVPTAPDAKPTKKQTDTPSMATGPGRKSTLARNAAVSAEEPALLRDRLLAEFAIITSTEEMTAWAHRSLRAKNMLADSDAQLVETSFQLELAEFGEPGAPREEMQAIQGPQAFPAAQSDSGDGIAPAPNPSQARNGRIAPKTIRLRDKDHRKFVATHPCMVCARTPADHTTCALHNLARSAARLATSSLFRSAGPITASFTGMVTRPPGGKGSGSTRSRSR